MGGKQSWKSNAKTEVRTLKLPCLTPCKVSFPNVIVRSEFPSFYEHRNNGIGMPLYFKTWASKAILLKPAIIKQGGKLFFGTNSLGNLEDI